MWKYVMVLTISLAVVSCDDDPVLPDLDPDEMRYDGANNSAPILPTGDAEAAIRFNGQTLDFYAGKKIDAVQYYIYNPPAVAEIVIYGQGSGNTPGAVLYEQTITSALGANSWNTIPLLSPLDLPTGEVWIGIRMEIASTSQVIGCDAGPAQEGGDWLFQSSDNAWLTFRGRGGESINWNIRAKVID